MQKVNFRGNRRVVQVRCRSGLPCVPDSLAWRTASLTLARSCRSSGEAPSLEQLPHCNVLWSGLGNHAGKAVISRRYLARQARALIEFAKSTTNPKTGSRPGRTGSRFQGEGRRKNASTPILIRRLRTLSPLPIDRVKAAPPQLAASFIARANRQDNSFPSAHHHLAGRMPASPTDRLGPAAYSTGTPRPSQKPLRLPDLVAQSVQFG